MLERTTDGRPAPPPAPHLPAGGGRLLRSVGYTEEIPAVGDWEMQPDGTFVLHTLYDRAAAEERIWFGTPDLRMRCSIIKTQGGKGVMTASLSTEVRDKTKSSK